MIPENEAWWGESFTDWVNVRRARPLFAGHNQPRVPLHENYYDLERVEAIRWQIDLAQRFGVAAFCHYHYWFEGRQLLERPTNLMLAHSELDFPFCLAWVNASWSRRWKGDRPSNPVLVRQTYSPGRAGWLEHFDYLCRAWTDPRHLLVDGKPVFLIYSPHAIPRVGQMMDLWREEAARRGLAGIHVVAMQLFKFLSRSFLQHFDAVLSYQPASAMFIPAAGDSLTSKISMERHLRGLPSGIAEVLASFRHRRISRLRFHNYEHLWARIIQAQQSSSPRSYPGAFVDWDNTARYAEGARIVTGSTPERFGYWMGRLISSMCERPQEQRLIFLNAWNEWAEGAYMEPDQRFGHAYLEALRGAAID